MRNRTGAALPALRRATELIRASEYVWQPSGELRERRYYRGRAALPAPRNVTVQESGFSPRVAPLFHMGNHTRHFSPLRSLFTVFSTVTEARIHHSCLALARLCMVQLSRTFLLSPCSPPHSVFSAS